MQHAFEHSRNSPSPNINSLSAIEFLQLADDIERALFQFDSTSNHAVMRAYRRSDMNELAGHEEEGVKVLEGGGDETVFLVYLWVAPFYLGLETER